MENKTVIAFERNFMLDVMLATLFVVKNSACRRYATTHPHSSLHIGVDLQGSVSMKRSLDSIAVSH
jgi:hypothetical protein